MGPFNAAQDFISEVTGTTREQRANRCTQANARRLAQMERKREKDAARKTKETASTKGG